MITQENLKSILHYSPETGLFTRLVNRQCVRAGDIAGYQTEYGYIRIGIDGKNHRAHRLAWLYMTGSWPSEQIDHINGIRSDNRWENLREATHGQNKMNSLSPLNKCGLKGVTRNGNNWMAQIRVQKQRIYLGTFASKEDAHAAYCAAADKHFGDFANHGSTGVSR